MAWVLVECISQYRMRYMVEAPDTHPDYALDTVTMEEAKEFSQKHLGEVITSHRVVSEEEALKLFDQDNDYLSSWDKELKMKNTFTTMAEQGYETKVHEQDIVVHTDQYYDTDRNR